jgi:hypothetical protein
MLEYIDFGVLCSENRCIITANLLILSRETAHKHTLLIDGPGNVGKLTPKRARFITREIRAR